MSDYNSSLPVRTEGDLQEKLQSKIVDFIDPTKGAEVDSDKNLHVELHGNDPYGVDQVLITSERGNLALDGIFDGVSNSNPSSAGIVASERTATPGQDKLTQRPTAKPGDNDKVALDVSISDSNGNSFTESNPLFVANVNAPGVEVCDFHQGAAIAAGATTTHTYSVTGNDFELSQVEASASGKMRIEVKVGPVGSEVTKYVGFNSTANPNISFKLKDVITEGDQVIVIKKNLDNQAQDLYSSILGKIRA